MKYSWTKSLILSQYSCVNGAKNKTEQSLILPVTMSVNHNKHSGNELNEFLICGLAPSRWKKKSKKIKNKIWKTKIYIFNFISKFERDVGVARFENFLFIKAFDQILIFDRF